MPLHGCSASIVTLPVCSGRPGICESRISVLSRPVKRGSAAVTCAELVVYDGMTTTFLPMPMRAVAVKPW